MDGYMRMVEKRRVVGSSSEGEAYVALTVAAG